MIDVHRHILPGLDDGPETLEEAVQSAKIAAANGVKKIIATPHCDGINLTNSLILEHCNLLNKALVENNIPVTILPGAEVQISSKTGELLRDGKLMTMNNGGKYLLVELPHDHFPFYLIHVLKQLKSLGVTPIIAHPERNHLLMSNKNSWNQVIEVGVLLQINAGSLSGYFGSKVRKNARYLVKAGYCCFLGSDCHGIVHKRPEILEVYATLKKYVGLKGIEKIAENHRCLVSNLGIKCEISAGNSIIKRIFSMFY